MLLFLTSRSASAPASRTRTTMRPARPRGPRSDLPLADLGDGAEDLPDHDRREPERRLVEDQEPRLAHERAAALDPRRAFARARAGRGRAGLPHHRRDPQAVDHFADRAGVRVALSFGSGSPVLKPTGW